MPAIITDQFRILNADTFTKSLTGIGTTTNNYYSFLAHPNPTFDDVENYGDASNWSTNPPEWILFSRKIYITIVCSF